ncbi:TIGR02588 family protein [Modestobacter lapidis]|nr:TIGR02588 family protein [Modestobacter lapidis]
MSESDRQGGEPEPEPERTSTGEYVLGGLGGLLVLLLLGFLIYQAAVVRDTGPELSVTVTGVETAGNGWSVHYRIANTGGQTAVQVQVTGVLSRDGTEVEESSATVDYVPPGSRRSGALLFSEDPGSGDLQVRPSGYSLP